MGEEPDQDSSSDCLPAAEQTSGWQQAAIDAATVLLAQGLHIEPVPERVGALLEAVLWRKSCRTLLQQVDHWPDTDPPQTPAEALAALIAAVPEAALLAVLAQDDERAGMLLGRASVSIGREGQLLQLAGAIKEFGLALDADALNGNIAGLCAALGAEDVEDAAADPAFLLHVLLMVGGEAGQGSAPAGSGILQAMRQAINVGCLAAMTALVAGRGDSQAAAVFGLLHASAAAAQSALAGKIAIDWDLPAIDSIMDELEQAQSTLLAEPSRLSNYVLHTRAVLLTTLAVDPSLPAEARLPYKTRARQALDALYARLQSLGQPLADVLSLDTRFTWGSAEVETGEARAQGRVAAITRLHDLLAMAALETNSLPRLSVMAFAATALATAQYETGHLAEAMDQAIVARRLARAAADLLDEAIAGGESAADEVRAAKSASAAIVAQAERTGTIARARLAESRGDFASASRIYSEAAQLETDLKIRLRDMLSAFFGAAVKEGVVIDQGFEAAARSAHFAGLAAVNLADAALMARDQQGALAGYQAGRTQLEQAALLWDQAGDRLPAGPLASDAARQAQISALRARYCDAKIAFAEAEPLIAADRHLEAAQKFVAARIVLQELVQRSAGVEDERNQRILQASSIYAEARSLFEIDLDSGSDDNLARARQRMVQAEGGFARIGEERWAAFIRAQSAACEAQILQRKAQAPGAEPDRDVLLTRASDRRQEAATIYAAAGSANGAGERGYADGGPMLMVLPKPQAPIGGAGIGLAAAQPARDDDGRKSRRARAQALRDAIADLERAYERGFIDFARKSQLTLTFRTELNQLEFELNAGENTQ